MSDETSERTITDETGETVEVSLTCFVIGPIGNRLAAHGSPERETYEESLRVMEEVIEPACQNVGLTPVRADTLARAGEITEQIFRRLRDDDVVIADLTGANANVMYELGLRHTENKLTVQLGEYGRLPFDVNTIRTIQFSRSPVGLINARDGLIQVLSAGLAGEYDPVTATRIWADKSSPGGVPEAPGIPGEALTDGSRDSEGIPVREGDGGFLDIMAEAEEGQDELIAALDALTKHIVAMGDLADDASKEIERSDVAGQGMRGRLQIATKFASGIDRIASDLEADADRFVRALESVSAGNLEVIKALEEDPGQLANPGPREFAMGVRQLANITRESVTSLAELVQSVEENAKLSRVLREPSRKLTQALNRIVAATSAIDEWDRRLQSLGVSVPPADWQPESATGDSGDAGPNGSTEDANGGGGTAAADGDGPKQGLT
jgi:hypothetical protein